MTKKKAPKPKPAEKVAETPAEPAPAPPRTPARTVLRDYKDPDVLALSPPVRLETAARLYLALDLGTNCGYAYSWHVPGRPVVPEQVNLHFGQLDLSAGSFDSGAVRFVRLRQFLSVLKPDLVLFERVRFKPAQSPSLTNIHTILARAATSMELFGAFFGTLAAWCEEHGVPCEGLDIQEIKKRATGRGNSGKEDIIKACNALFGSDLDPEKYESLGHDNVADAAWACLLALEKYGKGLPGPRADHATVTPEDLPADTPPPAEVPSAEGTPEPAPPEPPPEPLPVDAQAFKAADEASADDVTWTPEESPVEDDDAEAPRPWKGRKTITESPIGG